MKKGERVAKVIARSGYCSRRQAEELIFSSCVAVNGNIIDNPATLITDQSIKINGKLIPQQEEVRMWIFHKPKGCIVTNFDEKSRKSIFDFLPKNMPRVIAVGRLDFNTEGLLILTNDGEVARYIELPVNAWSRNYRVRVFGKLDIERLKKLEKGLRVKNVYYKFVKIELDKQIGANSWLNISLKEGKNREIKKALEYFGLVVNRLIRISFGSLHLGTLPPGCVKEVHKKVINNIIRIQK